MKLENQVCSLELSKHLKELGVEQKSLWWWVKIKDEFYLWSYRRLSVPKKYTGYSAFTCAELMKIHCELNYGNYPDFRALGISPNGLANFIAKKIVYLLENKLMGAK